MSPSETERAPVAAYVEWRQSIAAMREKVRGMRAEGTGGIAACQWYSDQLDALLQQIVRHRTDAADARCLQGFCLIAVGGNGRRRPAPYSDIDLLVIADPRAAVPVQPVINEVIRDFWDTGLQIGITSRAPADVLQFVGVDTPFATSLVETRCLAGNEQLYATVRDQWTQRLQADRGDRAIMRFMAARREEWLARGNSVNQLEPDVKRSPGGLRDLHLLRWTAFARYGNPALSELAEHGDIHVDEHEALQRADEFLTALRLDLHCHTALKQDVLTRELQLDSAAMRGTPAGVGMRPVEVFMQDYFGHTSRVAELARRVAEVPRRPSLFNRLRSAFLRKRSPRGFVLSEGTLSVPEDRLPSIAGDPVALIEVFLTAAEHKVTLSPELRQFVGNQAGSLPAEPEHNACRIFRDLLRKTEALPVTLRSMYETGMLEWLIPAFHRIRCLIQFNQYHSFTVDEHTLKAIDEVASFLNDDSPVGSAYRTVRHRATLHLAILLHDVGKGLDGDHSIIGEQLAEETATRLQMAENKKTMLKFLVRHHLVMPNLAFRRDTTDSAVVVEFARLVGAPELLRMLYVLTVADIRAVGPDVWSDWKGELLADLYNRAMQVLSGRPYNHLERERLLVIREAVRSSIAPVGEHSDDGFPQWIDQQLDALPPFYLMTEPADRIARDLDLIQQIGDSEVRIEGEYEPDTATVSYRVFAPQKYEHGSFHRIAGILSALRMNILAAQICTTAESTVIASFRVTDNDFTGPVPASRVDSVAQAITDVLTARTSVEKVFRRSTLYRTSGKNPRIVSMEPRVVVDNDCSERFTVIDVFASDTEGLLYALSHTLFTAGIQVQLARIATHIDQVVDVFYVVDGSQQKVDDPETLQTLCDSLLREIRLLSGP